MIQTGDQLNRGKGADQLGLRGDLVEWRDRCSLNWSSDEEGLMTMSRDRGKVKDDDGVRPRSRQRYEAQSRRRGTLWARRRAWRAWMRTEAQAPAAGSGCA
jgi:hypothetical protein